MRRTPALAATALALALAATACTDGDPAIPTAATSSPGPERNAAAAVAPLPTAPELRSMAMWSRGDLFADVVSRAMALDGVEAATHVRSDTLGLVGSASADGAVVDELTDGWRIPVDVGAVDPAGVDALLVDDDVAELVGSLAPGEVLLTRTGAELRGIGVGGRIDLEQRPDLHVAGIVPDGTVGRAEVIAHVDDADDLGLEPDGTLLLAYRADAPPTLADQVEALAPADVPVRVVVPDEDARASRAPLVLSLSEVKRRFGEFAYRPREGSREVDVEVGWMRENLEAAAVPILGTVWCHRAIVDDLRGALQAVVDAGLAASIDPSDYAGCFVARRIGTDTTRLSRHSWGIALDINVDLSLPGLGPPPDPEVIAAFEANGFRWGGDFLSPDNHHFEWVGEGADDLG